MQAVLPTHDVHETRTRSIPFDVIGDAHAGPISGCALYRAFVVNTVREMNPQMSRSSRPRAQSAISEQCASPQHHTATPSPRFPQHRHTR